MMLVLSRKHGESVHLRLTDGSLAIVRIVAIHPDRVKIAIGAPKEVVVLREELVPVTQGD